MQLGANVIFPHADKFSPGSVGNGLAGLPNLFKYSILILAAVTSEPAGIDVPPNKAIDLMAAVWSIQRTTAARAPRRVTSCMVLYKYIMRPSSSMAKSMVKNSKQMSANSTAAAPF